MSQVTTWSSGHWPWRHVSSLKRGERAAATCGCIVRIRQQHRIFTYVTMEQVCDAFPACGLLVSGTAKPSRSCVESGVSVCLMRSQVVEPLSEFMDSMFRIEA